MQRYALHAWHDGIGRTVPLQGNRYRLPQALFDRMREVGDHQLQHPRAAQHVLSKAVAGLLIGLWTTCWLNRVTAGASRPLQTTSTVPFVMASSSVGESATLRYTERSRVTPDVVLVAAELQRFPVYLAPRRTRPDDGIIQVCTRSAS